MEEREREALREEFLRRATAAFDRMFDTDAQANLVTFSEREDFAVEQANMLGRWLLECHIHRDPSGSAVGCACPTCGKLVAPRDEGPEKREVVAKPGAVGFERHGCYCPSCRKVFFPSGPET